RHKFFFSSRQCIIDFHTALLLLLSFCFFPSPPFRVCPPFPVRAEFSKRRAFSIRVTFSKRRAFSRAASAAAKSQTVLSIIIRHGRQKRDRLGGDSFFCSCKS